ncbi:MAG: radical SAM protein [Geobacteraceae bacterium]|nr:radical SAM protein [Geobacteraceae bacterium]
MVHAALGTARSLSDHPCYNFQAKERWGRIHLPVAPRCNIQCNYCNRLYDCANESRPGVTSRIMGPGDAVEYLNSILKSRTDISVIGIAGPGDALCDPGRTLATIRAVRDFYPDMLFCLSTNGLKLPEHVAALAEAGVTHVTVTVNAIDPAVGEKIYSWVRLDDIILRGREAAELLISRQRDSIRRLKARGIAVKINTVILPGINEHHVSNIAREVAALGADVLNCVPVIPIAGTPFAELGTPSNDTMEQIRKAAALHLSLMGHCSRCRADAVGLLEANCGCKESPVQNTSVVFRSTETATISNICNSIR